ncbi:hypothetical protein DSECCO2_599330 [anaerobic digester metagenome]
MPPLHQVEDHPEHERRREEHHAGRGGRRGQPQEEAEDQGGGEDEARDVEALPVPVIQERRKLSGVEEDRDGKERGHDEYAPPAEELGQGAAEERPEGEPGVDGGGVEPDSVAPLAGGIEVGDQGHAVCVDHGAAYPLQEPEEEERADRGREDGEEGPGGIDGGPGHEDPDPSPGVAKPPSGEEEDDRRKEVGARYPGKRCGIGSKLGPDGGKGEVDRGARERV